jgi:cell division septum initiation protein DivIVA
LDNEIIFKQFDDLENKIENLIKVNKSYETSNLELRRKIERLEEELQAKAELEKSYNRERELIRSKIDNLLAKITDIDKD